MDKLFFWHFKKNMKINLLNAEPENYSVKAQKYLEGFAHVSNVYCDRNNLLEKIPDFEALIIRLENYIDEEIFRCAKKLKVIVSATTGLNHIDLDAAKTYGVDILSLRNEREFLNSITATAELTWSLLLSLSRKLVPANDSVLTGQWCRDEFIGNQLSHKTIGIIGLGRLGSIVAQYANAFRMKVLAYDPYITESPVDVKLTNLESLLKSSDYISLHVPLNNETEHLVDEKFFSMVKHGAVLINTSRGEIIYEPALMKAMQNRTISAAGLDVLGGEKKSCDWLSTNELFLYSKDNKNLLITPHIGGATHDSMAGTELYMAKKLKEYLSKHFH